MNLLPADLLTAAAGLMLGGAFGATAQRTGFCTMGAIADVVLFGDWRRARSWLLALAVALAGTQGLVLAGLIEPARTLYWALPVPWPLVLAGALLFGFGMTLTGGCLTRNLVRLGAGSARALLVIGVLAATALATSGALRSLPYEPGPGTAPPTAALAAGALTLAAALLGFCLSSRPFRRARREWTAGLVVGLLVPAAWLATSGAGAGLNFVAAPAWPLLESTPAANAGFALALTLGAVLGAFAAAWHGRAFRIERFANRDDVRRHALGATLMGVGGALALGCTIGQGLAGVATLAPASLLALAGLVTGGVTGVRYLEQGSLRGAVRALFASG